MAQAAQKHGGGGAPASHRNGSASGLRPDRRGPTSNREEDESEFSRVREAGAGDEDEDEENEGRQALVQQGVKPESVDMDESGRPTSDAQPVGSNRPPHQSPRFGQHPQARCTSPPRPAPHSAWDTPAPEATCK
jgi:hypothetical protein